MLARDHVQIETIEWTRTCMIHFWAACARAVAVPVTFYKIAAIFTAIAGVFRLALPQLGNALGR